MLICRLFNGNEIRRHRMSFGSASKNRCILTSFPEITLDVISPDRVTSSSVHLWNLKYRKFPLFTLRMTTWDEALPVVGKFEERTGVELDEKHLSFLRREMESSPAAFWLLIDQAFTRLSCARNIRDPSRFLQTVMVDAKRMPARHLCSPLSSFAPDYVAELIARDAADAARAASAALSLALARGPPVDAECVPSAILLFEDDLTRCMGRTAVLAFYERERLARAAPDVAIAAITRAHEGLCAVRWENVSDDRCRIARAIDDALRNPAPIGGSLRTLLERLGIVMRGSDVSRMWRDYVAGVAVAAASPYVAPRMRKLDSK